MYGCEPVSHPLSDGSSEAAEVVISAYHSILPVTGAVSEVEMQGLSNLRKT